MESIPTMIIPEGVTKVQTQNQPTNNAVGIIAGGFGVGATPTFDPAAEKRMLNKLNRIEEMLERFSKAGTFSNVSTKNTKQGEKIGQQVQSGSIDFYEEDDDFDVGLAERLGKYKAFQQNPELIDFLHRHE